VDNYPKMITPLNHIEPVARRVRATLGGRTVVDTTAAVYVWEWQFYPQYYIPATDISAEVLIDDSHVEHLRQGTAHRFALKVDQLVRPKAGRALIDEALPGLAGMVRLDWDAMDAWFEEDEEVFVHPRDPYSRLDALRSTRKVRVELDGTVVAESSSPVMLFETGLPTRFYLNRTEIDFTRLEHTATATACPYKGRTADYWAVRTGTAKYPDLAWSYSFPTPAMSPLAGLVSFYNEKVDIYLGDQLVDRPTTQFS
jgi:uncharacterized protein (DUF427 family)